MPSLWLKVRGLDNKRNARFDEAHPPSLLGNCIANEIQISPELLDTALEWIAKNQSNTFDDRLLEFILNSKFADNYRRKVREIFFEGYDDLFAADLGSSLGRIYSADSKTGDKETALKNLLNNIKSDNFEEKCIAILGLMNFAFSETKNFSRKSKPEKPLEVSEIKKIVGQIIEELFKAIKLKNDYYYFSICWCLAWMDEADLFIDSYRDDFAQLIIYKWLEENPPNLTRFISWGLSEVLRPSLIIDFTKYTNIKETIYDRFQNPLDIRDKFSAIYLGVLIGIKWNKDEMTSIFNEEIKGFRRNKKSLFLFADELGIKLKSDSPKLFEEQE